MKSLMAEKIKKARLHRRMSQVQLNKQAELCPGHISKLESGGNHIPRSDTLQKIANATGLKMVWFTRGINFNDGRETK